MSEFIITTNAPESVLPDSTFSFDVIYTTQDPVDDTLSGLQLYLHFDSSDLSLPNGNVNEALSNLLLNSSERLVQVVDTVPNNNIPDIPDSADDGNPDTDSAIQVNYIPGAQNFPNQDTSAAGGGVVLYTVTFNTTTEFDGTTIEFTQPDFVTFDPTTFAFYDLASSPTEISLENSADTTPPEVEIQGEPDSITNTNPFNITFEFSEDVTGFELSDIAVGNGTANNFNAVDGDTYTADITPTGEGNLTINVPAGTVTDAAGNNNLAAPTANVTVNIEVAEDNQAPTLEPISVEGTEDQEVAFTTADFTSAFTDEDDDDLQSVKFITLPAAGSLSLNGEIVIEDQEILAGQLENLRYTPANDNNGEFTFNVTASDGTDDSGEATVTINLAAVNDVPSFALGNNSNQVSVPGESVTVIDFVTNINPGAANEDEQTLSFEIDTEGDDIFAENPIIDPLTGTLSYTLLDNVAGTSTVRVTLSDDIDTSSEQTFTISSDISQLIETIFEANADNLINRFAYDTTAIPDGTEIRSSITDEDLGTDAEFKNLIGLYEVANENGGINIDTDNDGVADTILNPNETGYARAAITNRVNNFAILAGGEGDSDFNTTAEDFGDVLLNGGRFYATFVIANGGDVGFDGFIANEDAESSEFNNAAEFREDLVAYFSFLGANPDGVSHLQNRGNGVFGFEDLPANLGISDNDFNDAVFQLNFTA